MIGKKNEVDKEKRKFHTVRVERKWIEEEKEREASCLKSVFLSRREVW